MPFVAASLSAAPPPARTIPVPRGLDSTRASPTRAPPLVKMRSGWTRPCTARPKMGSSDRMVCPPATAPPASATTSAAAPRMAAMAGRGRCSGKAERFKAVMTLAPMANTSLQALAAATAPKSAGSSHQRGEEVGGGHHRQVVGHPVDRSVVEGGEDRRGGRGRRPTRCHRRSRPAPSPPHLAAQPPHEVHSVRRMAARSSSVAGASRSVTPSVNQAVGADPGWKRERTCKAPRPRVSAAGTTGGA